ncbi:MAG: SGNH/GDSL hydrolase family protein [Candidatus Alcyoniella australis]|nr:SGNH/GDSL hydrolase family protein [Candidatus Alcyoniella australis]
MRRLQLIRGCLLVAAAALLVLCCAYVGFFLILTLLESNLQLGPPSVALIVGALALLSAIHASLQFRDDAIGAWRQLAFPLLILTALFLWIFRDTPRLGLLSLGSTLCMLVLVDLLGRGLRPVVSRLPRLGRTALWLMALALFCLPMGNAMLDRTFLGTFSLPLSFDAFSLRPNTVYEINDAGYRGPLIDRTQVLEPRLLCLGDSATFGTNVGFNRSYPARTIELLHDKGLDRAGLINLAMPAGHLGQQLVRYQESTWWKPQYVTIMVGIHYQQYENIEHLQPHNECLNSIRALVAFGGFLARSLTVDRDQARDLDKVIGWKAALTALVQKIRADGAIPILIIYPSPELISELREFETDLAQRQGVAIIDPTQHFTNSPETMLFSDAVHPTPLGHELIAVKLAELLFRLESKLQIKADETGR